MKTQLYPELTDEEYDAIIRPLEEVDYAASAGTPMFLTPVDVPLESFGADAERYSFEALGLEIARQFWHRRWDHRHDVLVRDAGTFKTAALAHLAESCVTAAIRPIADVMPSASQLDVRVTYQRFCRDLIGDGFQSLFAMYPVLWERLSISLLNQIDAYAETLQRVHDDRKSLRRLEVDPMALVVSVTPAGDTHHQGRSVSLVEFDGGTRIIYKPRSVDAEAGYQHLCAQINAKFGFTYRAAHVLRMESYGYVEFISESAPEHASMTSTGELLALMYILNARDMHFSNIVATRNGPIPVDLETLLHPLRQKPAGTPESKLSAYSVLDRSVYGTGVLPLIISSPGREGYVDAGYVGGGEQKGQSPFRQFQVTNPFQSDLQIVWAPDTQTLDSTAAQSPIDSPSILESCSEVVDGFAAAYRHFRGERVWLEHAIEKAFRGAVLRYIHNATVQYSHLLRMLTGSGASQSTSLAHGLIRRIAIASRGADSRLIESECQQLWDGDVPYFSMTADTKELRSGREGLVGSMETSPLEDVRAKLLTLSDADMKREIDLIRIAFYAKLPDPHDSLLANQIRLATAARSRNTQMGQLRDLGVKLATQIADDVVDDHFAHLPRTWVGPVASADPNRPWPPGVLGYDLYTGRVGTALSLLALGNAVEDTRLVDAAASVFEPIAAILTADSYELRSIARAGVGAYNGFSGTLWSLAAAGKIAGNATWTAAATRGQKLIAPAALNHQFFDVISGGIGVALTAPESGAGQSLAAQCEFALQENVVERMEYSGLAHGVAGVLLFSARAYKATGSTYAAQLVQAAVTEIETAFHRPEGLIRTNRTGIERSTDSWCNGAAGMLLGFHEAASAGLIDYASTSRMLHSMGPQVSTSLTICHGVLGLYETARTLTGTHSAAGQLAENLDGYLTAQHLELRTKDTRSRYNFSRSIMAGLPSLIWHIAHRLDSRLVHHSPAFLSNGASQ